MRVFILLAIVFSFAVCQVASSREWVDKTGKHKTEAEFVELKEGKVVLKRADGKTISVPLERLSDKDQDYVRELTQPSADTPGESTNATDTDEAPTLKGTLFGQDFTASVIEIEQDRVEFKSEDEMFPSQSLLLFLFSDEDSLAGQKFSVVPGRFGSSPHIHMQSKEGSKREIVMSDYTMKLSFDKADGRILHGKIDLKIPEHQTTLSGTFTTEAKKDYRQPPTDEDVPYIVATLQVPRGASDEAYVTAGYFGVTRAGKQDSNSAGGGLAGGGYVSSTTFEPRVSTTLVEDGIIKSQHVVLEPGKYFHYMVWEHNYWMGDLIEVEGGSRVESSLEFDLDNSGSLIVETSAEETVRLAPKEVVEAVAPLRIDARAVAFRLGIKADPENGKSEFTQLRPGKYTVVIGNELHEVDVKANEVATLPLQPASGGK